MGSYLASTARAVVSVLMKGNIDATLAANLPSNPVGGDAYRVTVAGSFEDSALVSPASSYFNIYDTVVWNANTSKWDYQNTGDAVSDSSYDDTAWDGETNIAGSKNAIRDQLNTRSTASGLEVDGTLAAYSGTNNIDAAASLKAADVLLDTAIGNAQTEVDAIETASGLETDGTLAAFSGTNYLDAISSLKAAIIELDSKVKSESIKYAIALGG